MDQLICQNHEKDLFQILYVSQEVQTLIFPHRRPYYHNLSDYIDQLVGDGHHPIKPHTQWTQ